MTEFVSSAEANRHFSSILREVRDGQSYVVTNHGQPVAKIIPASQNDGVAASAKDVLLKRLTGQPIVQTGGWTRDELYED